MDNINSKKSLLKKRIIAFIIDFFIVALIQGILFFMILNYASNNNQSSTLLIRNLLYINIFTCLLFLFKDIVNGESIGKRIVKICVRNIIDNKIPNPFFLFIRNITIIIWPIELFYYFSSKKNRRLGDLLAGTSVFEK